MCYRSSYGCAFFAAIEPVWRKGAGWFWAETEGATSSGFTPNELCEILFCLNRIGAVERVVCCNSSCEQLLSHRARPLTRVQGAVLPIAHACPHNDTRLFRGGRGTGIRIFVCRYAVTSIRSLSQSSFVSETSFERRSALPRSCCTAHIEQRR